MAASPALSAASPAEQLLEQKRPLVIAHRGYSSVAPENTLPAFERALAAGADLIELDYHHSREGVPIVIHDDTLDRTTDATNRWKTTRLKVADRTLAELQPLRAGLWFDPPFPRAHLPTLVEALEVIQRGSLTLIERKGGDAGTCVRLLQQRNLVNQVVVQAFDWKYLQAFHHLEPKQILAALGPPASRNGRKLTDSEKILDRAWLEEIKGIGARIAVWNRQVDTAAVRRAHELGLAVWVYTINAEPLAHTLIAAGVDGIITDNPAILWRALATRPR